MKIDLNGAYRAYAKTNTAISQQGEKHSGKEKAASGNIDRVSISSEAAQKSEFDRLVHSAATEADTGISSARLSELRASVQAGTYNIPTEKLADAVLNAYV
ncbi:MAG: flagellar biosynthesis anti-sigma factor FlgM [Angelakisella sp.]